MMAQVAVGLAAVGAPEKAEQAFGRSESIVRSMTDLEMQEAAFADLTKLMAHAGQFQIAESVALAIAGPYFRAEALTHVAKELMTDGQKSRARRLIGIALSSGRLGTPMSMQVLPPEVLLTMTELILHSGDWLAIGSPIYAATG
jgi:hypothetical protein